MLLLFSGGIKRGIFARYRIRVSLPRNQFGHMDFSWDDIVKVFLVGAFPWISEFKRLEIHFKTDKLNLSSIYNFFASLFASSLFIYSYYVSPYQLLWLPAWGVFIFISLILVIVYFIIFFFWSDKVNAGKLKGLVIVNFILYITIFCCLTVGFAKVKVFKDYSVISGSVVDAATQRPIPEADVLLIAENNNGTLQAKTDNSGSFSFFIDRASFNKLSRLQVNAVGYISDDKIFVGESSKFSYTKKIQLTK